MGGAMDTMNLLKNSTIVEGFSFSLYLKVVVNLYHSDRQSSTKHEFFTVRKSAYHLFLQPHQNAAHIPLAHKV